MTDQSTNLTDLPLNQNGNQNQRSPFLRDSAQWQEEIEDPYRQTLSQQHPDHCQQEAVRLVFERPGMREKWDAEARKMGDDALDVDNLSLNPPLLPVMVWGHYMNPNPDENPNGEEEDESESHPQSLPRKILKKWWSFQYPHEIGIKHPMRPEIGCGRRVN
jgi:hypothetical protein